MTDPAEGQDASADQSPQKLGESYESLLNQQPWQHDVEPAPPDADAPPAAEAPEEPSPTTSITPPEPKAPPPTRNIIEAMLFVGGAPLTAERAGGIIRGLGAEQFHQAIDELNHLYRAQARPYLIQAQRGGYVLTLRSRYKNVRELIYGSPREAQLSPAAVDVLSLVAYRQPATRQEIDSLRGAESAAMLRQLVRRGLIAVVQRGQSGHQEVAYGTTARFLELFGLKSLEDLPRTQDM